MSKASRTEQFFNHDLWTMDIQPLSAMHRFGIQVLRLGIAAISEFRYRLLDARAAGLVFTTLLSLVPFLAVMFSVLKAFGVHEHIEPVLAQALEPLGEKGEEITSTVIGFVDNLKVGVLGAVGVAGLFYTTYSLIDKIEQALNTIFRVRTGRSWGRKFTDYLSVVLVGPVLVFTAFGLLASIQSHTLVQRVLEIQPLGFLVVWAAQFIPFLLLSGVFTFLYKFVPNTQVQLRSAFIGGLTAAILWGIVGNAFAAFVASSAKYSAIYSSFAVLVLFLLWLYVGWLIILVGAQITFFHQHPSASQTHLLWKHGTHVFRERLALRLLLQVTRRYLKGEDLYTPTELAAEQNVPLSMIEELLEEFIGQKILCRVKEPEGIGLVKPPELVSVKEVLDIVRERGGPTQEVILREKDPVWNVLLHRDEAVQLSLIGITLRSLALEADADAVEPIAAQAAAPLLEGEIAEVSRD